MKHAFLSLFLSLGLAFSLCLPAGAVGSGAPFQDIHGHWAECQMTWAQETGILTGTSSTTLSPDDTATRAMAVTVLYRYAGSPAVEGTSGFADVPADAYYADGVAWCVQAGLITGKIGNRVPPRGPHDPRRIRRDPVSPLSGPPRRAGTGGGKQCHHPGGFCRCPVGQRLSPKTPWPGRWETFSCPVSARRETRGSYCRKAPSPGGK